MLEAQEKLQGVPGIEQSVLLKSSVASWAPCNVRDPALGKDKLKGLD